MKKANDQLNASISTVGETEQIAAQTLARLREQRESIQRSKTRIEEVDQNLNESGSLLSKMDGNCAII